MRRDLEKEIMVEQLFHYFFASLLSPLPHTVQNSRNSGIPENKERKDVQDSESAPDI